MQCNTYIKYDYESRTGGMEDCAYKMQNSLTRMSISVSDRTNRSKQLLLTDNNSDAVTCCR